MAKQVLFQARTREDEPAVVMTTGVASYGMLARAVESAVDRLAALDLPAGAMVVIDVRNPFHHVVLMTAIMVSRMASASIQNRHHLAQTGVIPDAILTDAADFVFEGSKVALVDGDWFLVDLARPVNYARLLAMPEFERPDEIVRVAFSSGTTGYPKAIALTREAVEHRILNSTAVNAGPQSRETRMLSLLGLSTLNGFSGPMLTLENGGVIAFAPDVPNAINLIRMFRIEVLNAAVFQLSVLLKQLQGKPPLSSLRFIGTGGSKMPPALLSAIRQKLSPDFAFVYASTEAGMLSTARAATLEAYPGTAGYLLPWVEMETVDAAGSAVPAGQDGILRVRTEELARYLNDTADTTERFGDGWFYPGDVGRVSPEGLVYITGRSSEILNRGGTIVAPDLIEEAILLTPGVKDAAVVGVPNAEGIEEIWAAVVGEGWIDPNAVLVVVGARMADKLPDRVVQVDAIPRNEMGKIKRQEVKDILLRRSSTP